MSSAPSAYITPDGSIDINPERKTVVLVVANKGDRAIQVGSHYHFYEVNAALEFDRSEAWGRHLAIPSGLAIRFEPGDHREVELVDYGGSRTLYGFAGLVNGALDDPAIRAASEEKLVDFLANSNAESNVSAPHAYDRSTRNAEGDQSSEESR